jgi:Domain of unknown function (DUF6984)
MNAGATLRKPSAWERAILERLFEVDFPGKNELLPMVAKVEVRTIDEDGSIELRSSVEGTAPVVKRIPVEAAAKDFDGFTIHVLFHAVAGRPAELEIYKDDGSQVMLMPDAHSFEVIVLGR